VPGFASGGFVGGVGGLDKFTQKMVGSFRTEMSDVMVEAMRAAIKAAKAHAVAGGGGPHGPIPSGSVGQWIARALGIDRTSLSWMGGMGILVGAESGGNPLARGPASADGYPEGIAQMKPGTFAAHMLAGYPDIWNPVDNLVSSIRYIHSQYGSVYNIPGLGTSSYQGYDSGTQYLPTGTSIAVNNTGRPERVGGEDLAPLLRQVIAELRKLPGAQAAQLGRVLSGRPVAPRPSVFAAR
jgi:hypothetical protein